MLYLITANSFKPNRLEFTEEEKTEKYHNDYARWCIVNANNAKYNEHLNRINANKAFYSPNKQWFLEEDLEGFFLDQSGQDNNRIRVEMNYIHSLVKQYMGNANRMKFVSRARSISPMVKSRKDEKMAEMLFMTDVSNMVGGKFGESLKEKLPIGKNEEETKQIFENIYVDHFVKGVNSLLRYSESVNKFSERQKVFAQDLALTGMCISKPYVYSGEYLFKRILPERFIFDRNAREWDLSDAQYMGEWDLMQPTEIYERFQNIDQEDREQIERFVSSGLSRNYATPYLADGSGRLPVFEVYWKDTIPAKYGWVKNEYGDISLERIEYTYEGEDKPRYTKKDLVVVSQLTPYQLKIINKGKKTQNTSTILYVDQWRFCTFIPSYVIGSSNDKGSWNDIILDYGIAEYQEPDLYSPSNTMPPYKVGINVYVDGDIYSPVDIAINPQRMINRFYSVFENQVNNSGGSGTVIDSDMVDDQEEVIKNMKQSKPIFIRSKGMGMPNVVSNYDNNVSNGSVKLIEFAKIFKEGIDQITGINEAVQGQAGNEQLVGVMQLMIQRGSIIQETFYDALELMYRHMYQAVASCGRRLYIDNERRLNIIVGNEDEAFIDMSEHDKLEDYRVDLRKSNDPDTDRTQVDSQLLTLLQIGLVDQAIVSNLYGRGTSEDLYDAMRMFGSQKLLIQQQQAQQAQGQLMAQQQQQQEMQVAGMEQAQRDKEYAMVEKEQDRQHDIDKEVVKHMGTRELAQMNAPNQMGV